MMLKDGVGPSSGLAGLFVSANREAIKIAYTQWRVTYIDYICDQLSYGRSVNDIIHVFDALSSSVQASLELKYKHIRKRLKSTTLSRKQKEVIDCLILEKMTLIPSAAREFARAIKFDVERRAAEQHGESADIFNETLWRELTDD